MPKTMPKQSNLQLPQCHSAYRKACEQLFHYISIKTVTRISYNRPLELT